MQSHLPTRTWEKFGSDIFQLNGADYLIIVEFYSRFPIIRPLGDTSASTISSHLTSLFAEYGPPSALTAHFGSQFVSGMFKKKCKESGIALTFSSPYHHQTNGVAEPCVGTTKSLWKKAAGNNQCPETVLWMYRITPLDDHLPSPYELYQTATTLSNQGTQPTILIKRPISRSKPRKQSFIIREPASTSVSLTIPTSGRMELKGAHIWEQDKIFSRQNPDREPRTYIVEINDKLYQRTKEHLRPQSTSEEPPVPGTEDKSAPTFSQTTSKAVFGQESFIKQPATTLTRVDSNPVTSSIPMEDPNPVAPTFSGKTLGSPSKLRPEDAVVVVQGGSMSLRPKSQVTRFGRQTRVPAKFKD